MRRSKIRAEARQKALLAIRGDQPAKGSRGRAQHLLEDKPGKRDAAGALPVEELAPDELRVLDRDLATAARAYGRAVSRVRTIRAQLRKAEADVKAHRRQMRLLMSARPVR